MMAANEEGTIRSETLSATVLIVDDDTEYLSFARRALARAGFQNVVVVANVRAGESLALVHQPRIALIDANLGEGQRSGYSLVKQIRAKGLPTLPVIVSGDSSLLQFFRAARTGATDYLVKGPALDLAHEVIRILAGERGLGAGRQITAVATDLGFLRLLGLTPGEVQIVSLLAQEFSRVGEDTFRPFEMVDKKTIAPIYIKLGVGSASHLLRSLATMELFLRESRRPPPVWSTE
jgi:DNA-binding response OmpR family regulator